MDATVIRRAEAAAAAEHPIMHRRAPTAKNELVQNVREPDLGKGVIKLSGPKTEINNHFA